MKPRIPPSLEADGKLREDRQPLAFSGDRAGSRRFSVRLLGFWAGSGHWRGCWRAGRGAIVGLLAWLLALAAWGEEPAERFLEALHEKGYHDAALMYLDRMEDTALGSPQFQQELTYHRGVTLVRAAVASADRAARERMLGEAKASLEAFLADQPESRKRIQARRQYSRLLREWAKMKIEAAEETDDAEPLQQAAALYDDAYEASVKSVEALKAELKALQETSPTEPEATERRDALRGEYLLSLLRAAECLEEKAATKPAGSTARGELLRQATKKYDQLFEKYGGYLAGLRARLYQARCATKLGDDDSALRYLTEDLLTLTDNSPAARELKTEAMLLAMDFWMDDSRKDYATVIDQGQEWLDTIRPGEREKPDWIRLRLKLARAYKRYADQLAAESPRDDRIKSSRESARQLARAISRLSGSHQEEARELLASIPGGVSAARAGTPEAPEAFEEARTRGTEAISAMQSAEYVLEHLPAQLKEEKDEEAKAALRKKIKTAEETVSAQRREAKNHLRTALRLAEKDTPTQDVNQVRRLLAYLHYVDQEYYQAIVLGEFVGRRYPGSPGARQSAQIALSAYLKLHETSSSEDQDFAIRRVISLANHIVETWSGTPAAAQAVNTLIPFLIRQGNVEKARQYVEDIPPSSPERGSAELRIGEALWRDYLEGMRQLREWERQIEDGDAATGDLESTIAARKPQLQAARRAAREILESGVERMKKTPGSDGPVPLAVLALARIYVDSGEATKAISLLDHPKIGVLSMLERDEPVVQSAETRIRAYRVALSAMVSALPQVQDTQERTALLDRIRTTINLLRDEVGDSPEGQKQLADIFFRLARGLETQLELLDAPEDHRVLSNGFRAFLEQVRSESDDYRVLNWVAKSFASLGERLTGTDESASAARDCYLSAASTYDDILEHAERHGLTAELKRQLRFRKALALRGGGQFPEAIDILKQILETDNNKLEYQVEAARTYQSWAADPKEGIRYLTAVRGTKADPKTGKRTVWGWSRIAALTQRHQEYREEFLEARYNTAVCHYELARRLRKDTDRETYLKKARNDIVFTHRLYPDLGTREWFQKYDALLKKIQRSRGQPVAGLARATNNETVGQP
ncbi:MAG: hypothetical protein ACQESR_19075 [Planctomycetota bacterium]